MEDDFEKVQETETINFYPYDVSKITEVYFHSFTEITTQIGGFYALIMSVFTAISELTFGMFLNKTGKRIKEISSSSMSI